MEDICTEMLIALLSVVVKKKKNCINTHQDRHLVYTESENLFL